MKRRLLLAAIAVSVLNVSSITTANAARISISPLYSIVDTGNSGGASGVNVNVGSNCDAKGACQGNWWKYGTFNGS